jgi:hypothetical protein
MVLTLAPPAGCASSHIDPGSAPTDITSASIERTYALLNTSPFQTTADAATAQELRRADPAVPGLGRVGEPRRRRGAALDQNPAGIEGVLEATAIYGGPSDRE